MLALILIYLFSLLGFTFFRDDFVSHVQTTSRSPYPSSRYRRPTSTTASTATLTRRSTRRCHRLLSPVHHPLIRLEVLIRVLSLSHLASTLASILDSGYCTKDNCSNDTLANHMSHAATALPEEPGEEEVERSCDTLFMCIVTTLNKGLRNGGGIGDVLRQPSSQVSCSEADGGVPRCLV